jgi:CO/xanthine dehydrogenase FAD-binding subunit
MTAIEQYLAPRTLEAAVQAMIDGDVTVLCGGTDLTVQIDSGKRSYTRTLMNIRRITSMAGVSMDDVTIRIGALTTVTELMEDQIINDYAPVLVQAGNQFASDQIRNAASIGGNICNASPAGDMIIPLLVLDAAVELVSWQDDAVVFRQVPLAEFFTGPGATVKRSNELLSAVIFNLPAAGFRAGFKKSGPRPALEIASVSICIGANLEHGRMQDVRVALGAVGPTPLRGRKLEAMLEGRLLDADLIARGAELALQDASPIDDIRASAWYRNHLVRIFTEDVLTHVAQN